IKIETSKTLSILIMGENHPSWRKRGYEMTKKLRRIFSPKLISLGVTLSADGAIISLSSRAPASKISFGKIEEMFGIVSFFLNSELKIDILFYSKRFLQLAGVKGLIEKFNNLFCTELSDTNARTDKSLFNHQQTLFELAAILVETCFLRGRL